MEKKQQRDRFDDAAVRATLICDDAPKLAWRRRQKGKKKKQ